MGPGAAALSSLYDFDEEAWLEAARAKEIALLGHQFLVRYARLAYAAHREGRLLWVIQPKLHAIPFGALSVLQLEEWNKHSTFCPTQPRRTRTSLGVPPDLSRRVTPKPLHSCYRVLERHLQGCYT